MWVKLAFWRRGVVGEQRMRVCVRGGGRREERGTVDGPRDREISLRDSRVGVVRTNIALPPFRSSALGARGSLQGRHGDAPRRFYGRRWRPCRSPHQPGEENGGRQRRRQFSSVTYYERLLFSRRFSRRFSSTHGSASGRDATVEVGQRTHPFIMNFPIELVFQSVWGRAFQGHLSPFPLSRCFLPPFPSTTAMPRKHPVTAFLYSGSVFHCTQSVNS